MSRTKSSHSAKAVTIYPVGTKFTRNGWEDGNYWIVSQNDRLLYISPNSSPVVGGFQTNESWSNWEGYIIILPKENLFDKLYLTLKQ